MDNKVLMSPIKREILKKKLQQERKLQMRAALPVLTRDEIRRYRLPRHEALLSELKEQGFESSKEYLEDLLSYQEHLRQIEGPNSVFWLWPQLKHETKHLDRIYETLKIAESAHYSGNVGKEIDELVHLGVYYAFGHRMWWWLAEQILLQCVQISTNYAVEGHKREAIVNFIYGKFLAINKKENEKAISHLVVARKLAKSMSWTAKAYLKCDKTQDNIFVEACNLLFTLYMEEAVSIHLTNSQRAIDICSLTRKYAANACDHSKEADALMFKGICYLEAGDPRSATIVLLKSLLLNKKLQRHEEICKARINLALAYIKVDNFDEAIKHLEALQQYAQEMDLPYYIGQTYRYLGEYYINQGQPQLALPILQRAVIIFHNLNAAYERLQVKNFSAIARGQLLLKKYVHLILRSDYEENWDNLMQLVDWKDSRVQFWDEDEEERDSIDSIHSIYRIDEQQVIEIKKGMSRVFLSSLVLVTKPLSSVTDYDESSTSSSSSTYSSSTTSSDDSNSSSEPLTLIKTEVMRLFRSEARVDDQFSIEEHVSKELSTNDVISEGEEEGEMKEIYMNEEIMQVDT